MGAELRVMTFNVRGAGRNDGKNSWPFRRDLNLEAVRRYAPDLVGFQEVQEENWEWYREHLSGWTGELGPPYNNGEPYGYPSVFWNPRKLSPVEKQAFWLSETPGTYSASWDTRCIRSALLMRFVTPAPVRSFLFLNTHLDHVSEEARRRGAALIADRIEDAGGGESPVVVTGDFNCSPGSAAYRVFTGRGFRDTMREHGRGGEEDFTFHGFTGGVVDERSRRIDWILYRPGRGGIACTASFIVRHARPPIYPSDHFPVVADFSLAGEGAA